VTAPESADIAERGPPREASIERLLEAEPGLREHVERLEAHLRRGEERRRALLHIMGDMNDLNKRFGQRRKAMLHILVDYEQDRRRSPGRPSGWTTRGGPCCTSSRTCTDPTSAWGMGARP